MKKLLLCVALAISLCALSQTARADLSGSWTYDVDVKITSYTLENGEVYTDEGVNNSNSDGFSRLTHNPAGVTGSFLEWGNTTRGNRIGGTIWNPVYEYNPSSTASSLKVTGLSGDYTADGTEAKAAAMVHMNQTINGTVKTPTVIELELSFLFEEASGLSLTQSLGLNMGFTETTNSGSYQSDVFYFLNPFENFTNKSILDSSGNETGYMFSLFSDDLSKLVAPTRVNENGYYKIAFDALNLMGYGLTWGDDIYGWITPEGTNNGAGNSFSITFDFFEDPDNPPRDPGDIDPTHTPEPATMLIFGLGIAGGLPLALRRRRNRN